MKKFLFVVAIVFACFLLLGCSSEPEDEDPTNVVVQYTITFNSNGGSAVTSITSNENTTVNKPSDPTKNGSTFIGWFTDSALTAPVVWPYNVSANTTFYAKWEEVTPQVTYTIFWEVNGSIVETDLNVSEGVMPAYDGYTPIKPATNQYEYTFTGWTPTVVAAAGNQTYIAEFDESIRQYSVQFNSNGGSSVAQVISEYNTDLIEPAEPTREGYNFVGWCLDVNLTQSVEWPLTVTQNQTLYAKWNETVPYGEYLSALLTNYSSSPLSYIPESLLPGAALITEQQSNIDYSAFVNLSNLPSRGFGEQWDMVLTNLEQAQSFYTILSVVDTLSSASIIAFNNYLDSNPADTAHYAFLDGIYSVTITFEDNIIYYVLDYTATVPVFGNQTIQIALSQDILSGEKVGRIQVGDANALRYVVTDDSYQFAIRYLGIRRAYFEISRDGDNVEGRIFEFLGLDDSFTLGSSAQFFINDDYASVVGNKSSSMVGWAGTITELYDVDSGDLLGYEIRETLSSITYNTMWFNLSDTSGVTSIKFLDAPIEDSNPYLVYVNGNENVFESKNVGGFSLKSLSRRYDIELRTQFFYYQSGDDLVKAEVLVPMIFVQEEQISTLVTDVNSMNTGLNFLFNLSVSAVDQITTDYSILIDPFILQKDEYTYQDILDFIGSKIE
jgi:uncharacterized repeat protein (TIGR02543 family)